MKRWPLGFLLVLALSAHAESFWDGNAAVQRGDAAFEAGMFAVSSAFARDTDIVIEDLATGKTTTARVTGRIADRLDILVFLSPAAALPLGLESGDVAHVRVTIKRMAATSEPILSEQTAPSADPDRVPLAVQREATVVDAGGTEAVVEAGEPVEVAEAVKTAAAGETATAADAAKTSESAETAAAGPAATPDAAPVAPAEVTPAGPEAAEAQPEQPETAEAAAATPEPGTSAEDAAFLAGLAARSPQKQLFLPPREDEMFAYQEPVEPPAYEAAEAVEVVAQPAETASATVEIAEAAAPEIASGTGLSEPGDVSEPIALAEAQPPAEIRPELVETLAATAPETEAETVSVFAEPPTGQSVTAVAAAEPATAEPVTTPVAVGPSAAPVAKPAEVASAEAAVKPATVQTVLDLPGKGTFTWYLQLAAYANEALARDTAARLAVTYPVLLLAPQPGAKALYRVFVGPLNKAESGTLLNYFRYRGFPDAFVRTAQK
jgi:cell division septation protein DedD